MDNLIAQFEAATEGTREMDARLQADHYGEEFEKLNDTGPDFNSHDPLSVVWIAKNGRRYTCWAHMAFTRSIDAALTLLPATATNRHLYSFGGHGRDDVKGDCWGFQCHDRAQLMGVERAERQVKNLKPSFEVDGLPMVILRKAIAEHFCEFSSTHAATAALAICITALKVRSGHITDDDLWPR
jgi:hypothetical protein